jgi:hypothetical protein
MIKNKYTKQEQVMIQLALMKELSRLDMTSDHLPPEEMKVAILKDFTMLAKRAQDFDPVAQAAIVEIFAGVIIPAMEEDKGSSSVSPSASKPLDFDQFFK